MAGSREPAGGALPKPLSPAHWHMTTKWPIDDAPKIFGYQSSVALIQGPLPNRPVLAAADQVTAVRTESNLAHRGRRLRMANVLRERLQRNPVDIPQPQLAELVPDCKKLLL